MGTNFYYFQEQAKDATFVDEGLHIGKLSAGWVFHFEAHINPELKTVEAYREFLKNGVIYDEYNRRITYEEFWKLVESSLEADLGDTEPPHSFDNLPEDSIHLISTEDWMDGGFMFTESNFC